MKISEIQVGKTYKNAGKGKTTRMVLRISPDLPKPWFSEDKNANEPIVEYRGQFGIRRLYITSFAKWAGSVVES